MAAVDPSTLSIEDLIQYVWRHWRETDRRAEEVLAKLERWGSTHGNSTDAALASYPIKGVRIVLVPQLKRLLSMQLSLWRSASRRERRRDEERVRDGLLGYLENSAQIREDVVAVVRKYGLG